MGCSRRGSRTRSGGASPGPRAEWELGEDRGESPGAAGRAAAQRTPDPSALRSRTLEGRVGLAFSRGRLADAETAALVGQRG